MSAEPTGTHASGNSDGDRVSMLDEALWSRFDQCRGLAESARVWLALQIRQIGGVDGGAVIIDSSGEGFIPVAKWPVDAVPHASLTEAVQTAVDEEAPAVSSGTGIAVPLVIDDEIVGAVGLHFATPPAQPTEALRQLRWGMGWLAAAARSALMGSAAEDRQRMSALLDLTGAILDAASYRGACLAAVNLLACETGCVQVGLGFVRGRRVRLVALSDVADFRLNTGHTRMIEGALAEATDQQGSVLSPRRPDQSFMVDAVHARLRDERALGEVLSVPMFDGARIAGALHFQKSSGEAFSVSELMIAESAAAVLGSILTEKRQLDRSMLVIFRDSILVQLRRFFGPRYLARKVLAVVLTALIAIFMVVTDEFRVKADAEVQGLVIRSVGAPFDGSIASQSVRAGDNVKKDDVLAKLDDSDLRIELLRAETEVRRFEGSYDRAFAERNAPEARIAGASQDEAKARAELLAAQIARAEMRAPFDAVVIFGDLSQSLGAAVRRGEELFQIAPLKSYRVRIEVEETDLDEIEIGQTGSLVLASLPGEAFTVRVTRITHRMVARDGLNVAMVEAEIDGDAPEIRPGMRGIAKVEVEQRLLIDIWTRPMIDWMRLALWRWTP